MLLTNHYIGDRVRKVINEMCAPAEEVTLDTHLVDDLEMDSLDVVEFSMMIEEEFDIEIPDSISEMFKMVKDVNFYLCNLEMKQKMDQAIELGGLK